MATGIKGLNVRFPEDKFEKLKAKKDASGLAWEAWILKIAGIANE